MEINIENFKKGSLLIAKKTMEDPFFAKTVILLCNHDEAGTMGLVINQPAKYTIGQMIRDSALPSFQVNHGGPIPESALMLHRNPAKFSSNITEEIVNGIFMGTQESFRKLMEEIKSHDVSQADAKVYIGYCGWGPGNLEAEILDGQWELHEATTEHIFNSSPETLWEELIQK